MSYYRTKKIKFSERYTRNIKQAFSNALNDFAVEERYIPFTITPQSTEVPNPSPTDTTKIRVSILQQYLLNLGAHPKGLIDNTGRPDGLFGPKTKAALLTIARDNGFYKVLTIPDAVKPYSRIIQIAPKRLIAKLESKSSVLKIKTYVATGPVDTTTNLPNIQSNTIGELIDKVRENFSIAQNFKDRIIKLEKTGKLSNKAITAYKKWFITATNLQRTIGNRLKSNKIFVEVDRLARDEDITGDELIYTISMVPVVNITKYTNAGPKLQSLPPSNIPINIETNFGLVWGPVAAIVLAGAAVAGIGLWKSDLILEEVRLMDENKIAERRLDNILQALEKQVIQPKDLPILAKTEKENESNYYPYIIAGIGLFSLGTAVYIITKKRK